MLNYVWLFMIVIGFTVGAINGRIQDVTNSIVDSSKTAIELSIGLLGIMCFWLGMMNIAKESGFIKALSRIVRPIMNGLFPEIPKRHPALGSMILNIVANMLGLGNAATPMGLKAMSELQELNDTKDTCTNSMSMFLILNATSLQIIPTTVIALRAANNSSNPTEVIVPIWITSLCATIIGIVLVKLFSLRKKY